jgi:hypothetical protein
VRHVDGASDRKFGDRSAELGNSVQDKFRSPIDPLTLFEHWWGEPLSQELLDRAANAPLDQQNEFIAFAIDSAATEIPDIGRGTFRPLIVQDGFHFANYDDYISAAVALALYSDEVAIEYNFGNNPDHFRYMLKCLLQLKPLAETGAIRFFDPDTSMHTLANLESEWAQVSGGLDLDDSVWDQVIAAVDQFSAPEGRYASPENFLFLVTSQLSAKSASPGKFSLLARSEPELVLLNAFAKLSTRHPIDRRGYAMSKLIGLRVPSYSLDISSLVKLRLSESIFDEWRSSLRNALNDIEGLPDGTPLWQEEARGIAADELRPLQSRIDRASQASPFLIKAKAGFKAIAFSAVGAGVAASLGADFKAEFGGMATAGAVQVASEYWQSVTSRNELRAVKDVIMAFTNQSK